MQLTLVEKKMLAGEHVTKDEPYGRQWHAQHDHQQDQEIAEQRGYRRNRAGAGALFDAAIVQPAEKAHDPEGEQRGAGNEFNKRPSEDDAESQGATKGDHAQEPIWPV